MDRKLLAIGAAIIVLILAGQYIAYAHQPVCSIDTEVDGSEISYEIKTDYDTCYTELHLKNGFDTPRKYYVLTDPSYGSVMSEGDMRSTCYLLSREIGLCGSISIESADANKVAQMMDSSLSTGTFNIGLIIITGAIPENIYDGTAGSKIVQWMNAGGCVCYSGSQFGMNIATPEGTKAVENWSATSTALFGTDQLFCIEDDKGPAEKKINDGLTEAACILYNEVCFGTRMSAAPAGSLFLGYTDDMYASIAVMKFGSGQLTHFGGTTGYQNIYSLAHVISLGITYSTELVSEDCGRIAHGSHGSQFTDSADLTHIIILSDLKVSRIWTYDRTQQKFV